MKRSIIAIAAMGAALVTSPGFANEVNVAHRDLNLTTIEGQKRLEYRIENAAKKVCGYYEIETGTRLKSAEMRRCYAKAKASAQKQMAAIVDDQRLGG